MADRNEMFWLVWDMAENAPIDTFSDSIAAHNFAREKAKERIGSTIVVLEPKEAYLAFPTVQREYLMYPDRADAELTPPPPQGPHSPEADQPAGEGPVF